MRKINYLIKRILKMNYKSFFKTIDKVHKKTHKNKLSIFIDVVNCGIKYQAGYIDYNLFEMYNLNNEERKTIITRGINNEILKKYNDKNKAYIFENKAEFNKVYDKFLKRKWLYLNNNYEEFTKYIKANKEIIAKPLSLCCGKGIEKIKIKEYKPKELYDYLISKELYLLEDVAKQHKKISEIYSDSVNTIRIVTLNKKVVAAFIRFGNLGNIVDNFNHDGMVTAINIDKGIIEYPAIDKQKNIYTHHPATNKKIVGLEIPMWDKVKQLCIDACEITPEIGYIGWDVCVGENEPCLIEGNDFPGHDLYQLPIHRKNGIGLLPIFKKAMEGKMNIVIATDHNGVEEKKEIIKELEKDYNIIDMSPNNTDIDDYPDYAFSVAEYVRDNKNTLGILLCGTGIGMSIAANKVERIRCAHISNLNEAVKAKEHNNANVIAMSYKNDIKDIIKYAKTFIETPFANEERHIRRNNKISDYEKSN